MDPSSSCSVPSGIGAGVYDGLTAVIASRAGACFLWLSSFSLSASFGLPDVGLIGPERMTERVRSIRRVCPTPLVVDLDSGHGDWLVVSDLVAAMAAAGADAVCIEDNPISKRSSLYAGQRPPLVTPEEHAMRIAAAREALRAHAARAPLVIARTEALVAGLGIEEALRRASHYHQVGADAVFVQSRDPSGQEVLTFLNQWDRRTPVFLAPTCFPQISAGELLQHGATHVIYANQAVRAVHRAVSWVLTELMRDGQPLEAEPHISSVAEVSNEVGADRISAIEEQLQGRLRPSRSQG